MCGRVLGGKIPPKSSLVKSDTEIEALHQHHNHDYDHDDDDDDHHHHHPNPDASLGICFVEVFFKIHVTLDGAVPMPWTPDGKTKWSCAVDELAFPSEMISSFLLR